MKAEIIAVGTEILLGQIVNSNATVVARQLAELGIESTNQQVVGDNRERLEAALQLADSRADLIVLIGGLGPTEDDLSKQVVADHVGVTLATDDVALGKLAAWAEQSQHPMTPNNRVQAMYPAGATVLPNAQGLAVGALVSANTHRYVLLPGPPKELIPMVLDHLVPALAAQLGNHGVLASRVMRFFGIGESQLVSDLADLIAGQSNPTLATYINDTEVTLRITARADSTDAAQALIAPVADAVLAKVGAYYYGDGDDNTLEAVVVAALARTKTRITAAESLTAGAFMATLGNVPGVSDWFKGGWVTYANTTKAAMLDMALATIDRDGAVSEATAAAMATHALAQGEADLAVSLTGVAGPGPSEGQPAGTVWIGLAQTDKPVRTALFHLPGYRAAVRHRAVKSALFMVLQALGGPRQ